MTTLTYLSDTALDIGTLPEQWRTYVTQTRVFVLGGGTKYRVNIQVQAEDSSYRYRALMQKPQLVLKFSLPFYLEFPVGTSCTFQNQRFELTRSQDLRKQGERNIEYSMTMYMTEYYFSVWKLRNVIDPLKEEDGYPKDNRLKFSQCMKPHEYIDLIVRNLNKKDTSVTWEVGECIEASEKTVEFNHTYIDAALTEVANAFESEYEIEYVGTSKAKIHLKRVEYFKDAPVPLAYGVGNGFIPGVGRTSEADGVPVKRMFTQGSDRNIDRSTYGAPELLMPKGQTIRYDGTHFEDEDGFNSAIARTYKTDADGESVERIDVISQATKEDSLDCSEIYPSRVGEVTDVQVVNADKNFYDIIDATIPSDLNFNNYLIAGETMTIIFQDGMLAGKEFDVKYKHDERRFEIVPQEIDGVMMPNATFTPKNEQKYAIFGIQLPEAYICNNTTKSGASWDMMRAAVKSLYENEDQRFTFSGSLQALWAKRHWNEYGGKLIVGGHVLFTDKQFAPDGQVIRIVGIKDYLTAPYSPTIELSNGVSASSSVSSQLRQITNTEVVIDETKKTMMQYTKRRFRDALETLGMLEDAHIGDFSGCISPVAVQTMSMLVGDESLQFQFIERAKDEAHTLLRSLHCITYDNDKKQLFAASDTSISGDIYLQHMTLGQHAIMTQERRENGTFVEWKMQPFASAVLAEASRSYYVYARVSATSTEAVGTFLLSEKAITMEQEAGYYHFLCGVLNSEIEGQRSYVSLYGFSEILPGRITTSLIISNDGKTYFDLEKGEIGGALKFLSDSGYITIIEGGKIKTELIDVSEMIARKVIVGEPEKNRIEIQPDENGNGSVKIFDKNDNEVTVFEGTEYKSIAELYDGTTGDACEIIKRTSQCHGYASGVTLGRGSAEYAANSTNLDNYGITNNVRISKVWKTNTPTEIELTAGHISATAYAAGYQVTNEDDDYSQLQPIKNTFSAASAQVSVRIETYSSYDEATDTLSGYIDTSIIASAYAGAEAQLDYNSYYDDMNNGFNDNTGTGINKPITEIGGTTKTYYYQSDSSYSGVIDIKGKKVRVPGGYHVITVYYHVSASRNGSNASLNWGYTSGSRSDIAAKWLCDFYVSRYFANGFCLGTRNDNYIIAYKTDEGMRFVMESNDIGFEFSNQGLRTRAKGTNWMPLPMLIFKASYQYASSAYTLRTAHGYKCFCKDMPEITRRDKGLVTLTFPDSWKTALGSIGVQNLLVQVNAHHQVIDARVEEITTSAIKVAMSDDASRNDGDFGIVIYYLAS